MNKTIVFIGGGNMARSLVGGLTAKDYPAKNIWVADPAASQLEGLARDFGVNTTVDNAAAVARGDVLVFAVKPQILASVAAAVSDTVQERGPLVMSVVAGIRAGDLSDWLGGNLPIVRTMPNRPALNGCGVSALYANESTGAEDRQMAEDVMRAAGSVTWVKDEALMDPVTAVSGSGPAYYFLLMEIIEQTAKDLGLDAEAARTLTVETAYGAARMAREGDTSFSELRRQVTSAGGTTAAALDVLEHGNIRTLIDAAVKAASNRSHELSREFGTNQ